MSSPAIPSMRIIYFTSLGAAVTGAVQSADSGQDLTAARRHRHGSRLSLLRRRLWAAHLHQGRQDH